MGEEEDAGGAVRIGGSRVRTLYRTSLNEKYKGLRVACGSTGYGCLLGRQHCIMTAYRQNLKALPNSYQRNKAHPRSQAYNNSHNQTGH